MDTATFSFHDFHPPDEVRVFAVPAAAIRRSDSSAIVYDLRINDLILRHYAFLDRWFAVNCTLNLDGHFIAEDGPISWCFNCDITTPLVNIGSNLYTVDLALDVLVGPDGQTHIVKDEDDFLRATRQGWLSDVEQRGARAGLDDLLTIIRTTSLVAYLNEEYPFGLIVDAVVAPSMMICRYVEVPEFRRIRG